MNLLLEKEKIDLLATEKVDTEKTEKKTEKKKKEKVVVNPLLRKWQSEHQIQIGLDEAGRGPLFGRLFVGGVVLPDEHSGYEFDWMKDSKKFTSHKKRKEVADYIKSNAIAWHVAFVEPEEIDRINILQSVYKGMHECVLSIMSQLSAQGRFQGGYEGVQKTGWEDDSGVLLLVDGNRFDPMTRWNESTGRFDVLNHICIEGGDNKVCSIAAASILAKTAHDDYVTEMCSMWPELERRYCLTKGMGYATRRHLDGIKEHGVTQWHRRTFGDTCRNAALNPIG
jgi:ribonuclease HII